MVLFGGSAGLVCHLAGSQLVLACVLGAQPGLLTCELWLSKGFLQVARGLKVSVQKSMNVEVLDRFLRSSLTNHVVPLPSHSVGQSRSQGLLVFKGRADCQSSYQEVESKKFWPSQVTLAITRYFKAEIFKTPKLRNKVKAVVKLLDREA